MMQPIDLFNSYKELYEESFIIKPVETDEGFSVILEENDKSTKLREITIYNVPQNSLLFPLHEYSKLALGEKLKNIINAERGVFKCCDYLLVSLTKDGIYLIFIELKSNKIERSHIIQQFKGASCFIEYCHAIIKHFYDKSLHESPTLNMRYVLVSRQNFNKTPTNKNIEFSRPDCYYHHKVGNNEVKASAPFGRFR